MGGERKLSEAVICSVFLFGLVTTCVEAKTYELVHAFGESGYPVGGVIRAADGYLYGTTSAGGTMGVGTIFRSDSSGSLTTLHSFGYADGAFPVAALVEGTDGFLYGTASWGGPANRGTVFRIGLDGAFQLLHAFSTTQGANPWAALVQGSDGKFYGTTLTGGAGGSGTVFKVDSSGTLTTLHSFNYDVDGGAPLATLIQAADGLFYGTASAGGPNNNVGTAFKISSSGQFTRLHVFQESEGLHPNGALVQAADGYFYGTTVSTFFKMDQLGNVTKLHEFVNWVDGAIPGSLTAAGDGSFYGTTHGASGNTVCGTVFRIDASGNVTTLHVFDNTGASDGCHPTSSPFVLDTDGATYGLTQAGSQCCGTMFKLDSAAVLTTLLSFGSQADGAHPGSLIVVQGMLRGSTGGGGLALRGTLFKIDPSGRLTTTHTFDGVNGSYPGGLIAASDGSFYGITAATGVGDGGTIFRATRAGGLATLHHFMADEGVVLGLVQIAGGDIYGTTAGGGTSDLGTVFKMSPSGGVTTVHSFTGSDGADPVAVTQGSDGNLYGTTGGGGAFNLGTVFKMDLTGGLTSLYSFAGDDGAYPAAALVQATDGKFYGTTFEGGIGHCGIGNEPAGTAFRIDSLGNLTTLQNFTVCDAADPAAPLIQGADGNFYGTSPFGGDHNQGTVFELFPSGGLAILQSFDNPDGTGLTGAPLVQGSDGSLYGVAASAGPLQEPNMGGLPNGGVVFRLSSSSLSVNAIVPTSGPASGSTAVNALGGGFLSGATLTIGEVGLTDPALLYSTFMYGLAPALSPGTLNDIRVTNPGSTPNTAATLHNGYFADFLDVAQNDIFHDFVESIFRAGITAGCGGGNYCRDNSVRRDQMAVFLLKAEHGSSFVPPACTGIFLDVPCPGPFTDWVEQLAGESITGGCGGENYCPSDSVTRSQMAALLLKTEHGVSYTPPPCTGVFGDVACPSLFAGWIEQLYAEGVTGGCSSSPLLYCPDNQSTRAQMAVFLNKAFQLF